MKKYLFLFVLALFASIHTASAASGTCGENLTWDLSNGVLTITGTGAMSDYEDENLIPWYSNRLSIKTIIIADGVTSIGKLSFYNCFNLDSVDISNSVISIGNIAFLGCSGITSLTISNNLLSIGESAFSNCSRLPSVTIPNSVTSIGKDAFRSCSGLTSVTILNNVTSIGYGAFSFCHGLKEVHISDLSAWCKISFGDSDANPLTYAHNLYLNGLLITDLVIPNSVTSIGSLAFKGCSSLTSVTIPNSVTSIGGGAFYSCSSLTSVTIPNSVTSIGSSAFYDCNGLTSVTIPNSVTSIGENAFDNVFNVVYNGTATGSPWGAKSINGYIDGYLVYSDANKIDLRGCHVAAKGEMTIPNSVTSIGSLAFEGCSGLTSINIPNSVTSIGSSAFDGCSGLKEVHISDLVAWCKISFGDSDANPLTYAHNLYLNESLITDLVIPNGVTSIGDDAFYYCSALTSVTIPNSVTSIGNYAFYGCNGLTSVTISNSVTAIGNSAFYGCNTLTSVTIPNSVTSIGKSAFGCSNLKAVHISNLVAWCKIGFGDMFANPLWYGDNLYLNDTLITDLVIPDGVSSIGNYTFYGCKSLTSVTISNGVKSIGEEAFYGCNGVEYIISLRDTPPTIKSNSFPTGLTVYVNNEAIESYQKATNWKNYNIKELISNENTEAPTSVAINITNNLWNLNNKYITSCGIEGGEQQPGNILEYIGLEPNSEYEDVPIVLTSNTGETETVNVSFTTTALELTTKASKPVSSTTAILLAETNMADIETSCGFEWRRNDQPEDMASNQVICPVANGLMAGRLKGLKDDVYYKYRAFYKSAAGNMYYGDWQYIFTGDVAVEFDPILYTYEASNVQETQARLRGYALAGSDDFTEQGFEYWADSRAPKANGKAYAPQATHETIGERHTVQASGISMAINLQNLDAGTVYHYHTYAKIGTQTLYGAEMSFTTKGEYTPPTYTILFVNYDGSPLLTISEVEHGTMPVYTGDTPVRDEDAQYTYTFSGWEPEVVAAVADATYTATYTATPKTSGIGQLDAQNAAPRKVIENGNLYIILPDGKKYDAGGKLTK